MESYEEILERIPTEVSLGYQTIRMYRVPGLSDAQIGYSVSPTGQDLTGVGAGDWQREWVVVGYEECCGDPIFIDSSKSGFPVYTATHGEGAWEPNQVAESLDSFARTLSSVAQIAKGREHPVALERNPITPTEREAFLTTIRRDNPGLALEFWELLLTQD